MRHRTALGHGKSAPPTYVNPPGRGHRTASLQAAVCRTAGLQPGACPFAYLAAPDVAWNVALVLGRHLLVLGWQTRRAGAQRYGGWQPSGCPTDTLRSA